MRHHVFSAAMGIALAAVLVPAGATTAQAGDPTGYWRKANQGQFPAKMQLYRCGGRSICVKIVWLQNPRDSKGRVLQDVRNVNPSLRKRTIEGMHIIRSMKQVSASQWKGKVYNPEDGKTYSATVTLASSRKIVLKGCVASFLCREQVWLRTSAPPPREEEKPEPTVEASVKPAVKPPVAAATTAAPTPAKIKIDPVASPEVREASAPEGAPPGMSYGAAAKSPQDPGSYTGESVSSMFSMAVPTAGTAQTATTPVPAAPTQAPAVQQAAPVPASRQASVQPDDVQPEVPQPEVLEPSGAQSEDAAPELQQEVPSESATADSVDAEGERLSWRERRQLRRQKRLKELQQQGQNFIPWMRQ